MPYSYKNEDEFCYHMQHPDGSDFRIAKAGLQEKVIKQIESMKPRQMADGGIVGEDDDDPLVFDPFKAPSAAEPVSRNPLIDSLAISSEDVAADEGRRAAQIIGDATAAEKAAQDAIEARQTGALRLEEFPGSASKIELAGDKAPSIGDQAAKDQAEALALINQADGPNAIQPSPPAPRMPDFGSEVGAITRDLSKGYQDLADAQEKAGALQAQEYEKYASDMENLNQKYQVQADRIIADLDQLQKETTEGKIDPNRLWNNMDTGRKTMAVVGLILSSIGSGYRGTENAGLKILDNMVNRDIELQKSELGKKQSLLSLNLQKLGSLRDAQQMTRLQMAATVEARIKQVASQSQSEQAKMNAQVAIAKIRAEMLPVAQKLALSQAQAAAAQQGSPIAQRIQAMPENIRQEAWKEVGAYQEIQANIQRATQVIDEAASYATVASTLPFSQAGSLRETAFAKLFPIAKAIAGERMTDADARTLIQPYLPKVTDTQTTLNKKKQGLIDALNAQVAGRVPRLVQFGIIQPPRTAKTFRKD